MKKQEIWKSIPGFEGYEVSNEGRIRSYFIKTGLNIWGIADIPQRILKSRKDPFGYPSVNLRKSGVTYHKRIHRIILLAFVGPCPDDMWACHNNDIPDDNRLENLRYDTPSENLHDVTRNGNRSLSIQDVKNIRCRRALRESVARIAEDYDVSLNVIKRASTGVAYKCVDAEVAPVNIRYKKLTPNQVLIIKWLLLNKAIIRREIANCFEVSSSMITRIANGTRRADVSLIAVRLEKY